MMNKKTIIRTSFATLAAAFLMSAMPADEVITKDGSTTIVNTTLPAKGVRGYKGATPLKIYIKKNRVEKIEVLKNQETPKYFARAKAVLDNFIGKTVTKAEKTQVDAVSGATFSSDALIKNVQAGLKYYKENK